MSMLAIFHWFLVWLLPGAILCAIEWLTVRKMTPEEKKSHALVIPFWVYLVTFFFGPLVLIYLLIYLIRDLQ